MKKILVTLLVVFVAFSTSLAQQIEKEQKDTLFVRVLNKYVLLDGKKTSKYYAAGQEFRDSLGRLLNEINFDDATHMPTTYSRYTYNGMNRIREEHFANNRMVWRTSLGYDGAGALISKRVEKVSPGDTMFYLSVTYKNTANGMPKEEVGMSPNGKVAYKAKFTYDKRGELLQKKVSVKSISPMDSILLLKRTPLYDSLGRVISESVAIKNVDGGDVSSRTEYKFGKDGFLSELVKYDATGKVVLKQEHIYNVQRKRIQEVKSFDGSGKLLEWRGYRYERYGSQPYMVRVID